MGAFIFCAVILGFFWLLQSLMKSKRGMLDSKTRELSTETQVSVTGDITNQNKKKNSSVMAYVPDVFFFLVCLPGFFVFIIAGYGEVAYNLMHSSKTRPAQISCASGEIVLTVTQGIFSHSGFRREFNISYENDGRIYVLPPPAVLIPGSGVVRDLPLEFATDTILYFYVNPSEVSRGDFDQIADCAQQHIKEFEDLLVMLGAYPGSQKFIYWDTEVHKYLSFAKGFVYGTFFESRLIFRCDAESSIIHSKISNEVLKYKTPGNIITTTDPRDWMPYFSRESVGIFRVPKNTFSPYTQPDHPKEDTKYFDNLFEYMNSCKNSAGETIFGVFPATQSS